MLHGSETWQVNKDNEMALEHLEMTMNRLMACLQANARAIFT